MKRKDRVYVFSSIIALLLLCLVAIVLLTSVASPTKDITRKIYSDQFFIMNSVDKYDITIIPDIKNHVFNGTVTIFFPRTTSSKAKLELDASKTLHFHEENNYSIIHNKEEEKLILTIPQNTESLTLNYDGKIFVDDLYGLYQTKDVVTGTIGLATQFESDYARRVFPCIDSPHTRSVFKLSIYAEKDLIALANTKVESQEDYKEGTLYHFKETPSMTSYLVAFCVGKWDKISTKTKRGVEIDIYTLKGRAERGKFSLELAANSIDFYEKYTGVNYVMDALQVVAIPDFAAGAMENYGLVTSRDFFVDCDNETSIISLSRISEVIVHENAHMWFGNLVSPRSWAYTWLNEGFATILPHIALEGTNYFPWSVFYYTVMQGAIDIDISSYTHPIMFDNFSSPDMMFDDISYNKGATVLNMLRLFLTDDVFQQCLKEYLSTYKFTSTTTEELIKSFEKVSGKEVRNFIRTWTEKEGFPTLLVSKTENGMKITQKRITPSGEMSHNVTWPLTLFFSNGKSVQMETKEITVDWFSYVNPGRKVMTIVSYSSEIIEEMKKNWSSIPDDVKWCFLNDLQKLALCGLSDAKTIASFIELCTNEQDAHVISSLASASSFIISALSAETTEDSKNHIKRITEILKKYIRKNKTSDMTLIETETRKALLTIVGHTCGDEEFVNEFKEGRSINENDEFEDLFFYSWTDEGFEKLIALANESNDTRFIQNAQAALSSTRNKNNFQRIVAMFGNEVKWQNAITVLTNLASNLVTKEETFKYMCENLLKLYEIYGDGFRMENILQIAFSSTSNLDEHNKLVSIIENSEIYKQMSSTCDRFKEYNRKAISINKMMRL